jgi:hypothetical protein
LQEHKIMRDRRLFFWLAVASASAAAAAAPSAPAFAAAGTTAVGAFVVTVSLPTYPCGFGSGCGGGSLSGTFAGMVAGTDTGTCTSPPLVQCRSYEVTWPDPSGPLPTANLGATFSYTEGCPVAQGGSAAGSFTISGGLVDDNGTLAHDGTMTGSFTYSRTGLAFTIELTVVSVTGNGHVLGTEQLPLGVGAGLFAPLAVETCAHSPSATAVATGMAFIPE